jgi:hypothetical protein
MQISQKTIEKLRTLINEETEYRSGPQLVTFFNDLGFNDSYGQGFPSRWMYTEEKIKAINGTAELDKCIKNIFAPINYISRVDELDAFITDFNQYLAFDKWQVIRDNDTITFKRKDKVELKKPTNNANVSEDEFLKHDFKDVNIDAIGLDNGISDVIKLRLKEIENCINYDSPLAVIFLCGSTLEGLLLGIATKHPSDFNKAKSAPKDKEKKVKKLHDWTLNSFIDVSCELGFLKEDVKKYSHTLKDFRNYIHPYQQLGSRFNPDKQTAKISWQVLKTAIHQIGNKK